MKTYHMTDELQTALIDGIRRSGRDLTSKDRLVRIVEEMIRGEQILVNGVVWLVIHDLNLQSLMNVQEISTFAALDAALARVTRNRFEDGAIPEDCI